MHRQSSTTSDIASDRPRSRNLAPLRRLLGFVRPYTRQIFGAAFALLLAAAAVLAFGQIFRAVVDNGFGSGSAEELNRALVGFLGAAIILAGAIMVRVYLLNWLGERVIADIRRAVFDRVLTLDVGFFETTRTGEVISRLTSDTALLQVVVGNTLAVALRTSILVVGGLVMLAITSPRLAGLVLIGTPLVVVPLWLLGHRVRRLARNSQDRVADVGAYIDEVVHGIRTVQAFGHEPIDRLRYGAHVERACSTALQRVRVSAALSGVAVLITFVAIGTVLWIGGHEVLAGRMSAGELSAFVFYAVLVASSVGTLSEIVSELLRGAGASERLMELVQQQPAIRTPARPTQLNSPPRGCVEAVNLRFAYPSNPNAPVFSNLSFALEPGEKVALVGPSGAGKSTVFQLLLRFFDPQAGALYFDGVDLRELAVTELRRNIAIVPQDPVIFADNAWENIRYGLENVTEADIRAAADAAHATDFIDRLPDGFDTFLGERGVRLSGGQRQRIAIARAILRNPKLLLLDEATSALDAESERVVQQALEAAARGRTTVVIAHRLATVRKMDRILVMDHGQIVASGTHDTLMAENGLYAHLATLQFQRE
ncbi:MAG: ABC transporter transmembrane domain-containing protein [Thiotrichales bacterium]